MAEEAARLRPRDDEGAADLVRTNPLALVLLRLPDGQTLEVSDAFAGFIGKSRRQCLSMNVADYSDDPEGARVSLSLLAAGTIESYTRRVRLLRSAADPADSAVHVTVWFDHGPRRLALGMILPGSASVEEPDRPGGDGPPPIVVIGTLDDHWRIDRITTDGEGVFLQGPEELLGGSAFVGLHAEDVGILLMLAAHSASHAGRATGHVRVRGRAGGWLRARLTLQPLAGAGPPAFAFSLILEGDSGPSRPPEVRDDLTSLLERNRREIRAAGLAAWMAELPNALDIPELSALTSREYEIVLRLASGHRVSGIAKELFVSQSTVRNHLTSVYRKFGVHSQTGLLERLRR